MDPSFDVVDSILSIRDKIGHNMSDGWGRIPADVFLDILQRIPPCPRRRLRLVCRHWRDAIDERTPEPRASAKVLAFSSEKGRSHAYVFDDLTRGRSREVLQGAADMSMIGTCNGLLCCLRPGRGDIAVINPVTRETVAVGLASACYYGRNEATYSFGYHPGTGQYKIVHVPRFQAARLDAVRVLTLGDGPGAGVWREVPAPAGSSCFLRFGLASIGGVTYWVTADGERVMSFDLKDERVALVGSPPVPAPLAPAKDYDYHLRYPCHLTDVPGRLGLAVRRPYDDGGMYRTEVWVLEGGGRGQEPMTWVKRYMVVPEGVGREAVASPHVVHGEHVLTTNLVGVLKEGLQLTLHANRPRYERKMRPCGMVSVGPTAETVVGTYDSCGVETFAYFETREPPLFVYQG